MAVWRLLAGGVVLAASGVAPGAPRLEVYVAPTIQYAFEDIWYHTPSGTGTKFAVAGQVVRHQPAVLLVNIVGAAADAAGRATVSYDLTVRQPDGTVSVDKKGLSAITRRQIAPGYVSLAETVLGFVADDQDPQGRYVIHVVAHDQISGAQADAQAELEVVTLEQLHGPPADFDADRWLTHYYLKPEPQLALPALLALSHKPDFRRPANRLSPLLGFYEQVLADNPWLAPSFKLRFATTRDDDERRLLSVVLAYVYRDDASFARDLPDAAQRELSDVPRAQLPLPSTEPTDGGQLDLFWGRFFASGRFQPIRDLVMVVQNDLPYQGALENYRKLTRKPPTVPAVVVKDWILGDALWSLGSNAHQHELVRNYLLSLLEANDTSPAVKAALRAALAGPPPPWSGK